MMLRRMRLMVSILSSICPTWVRKPSVVDGGFGRSFENADAQTRRGGQLEPSGFLAGAVRVGARLSKHAVLAFPL